MDSDTNPDSDRVSSGANLPPDPKLVNDNSTLISAGDVPSLQLSDFDHRIDLQNALQRFKNSVEEQISVLDQCKQNKIQSKAISSVFKATSDAFLAFEKYLSALADDRNNIV